MRPASNFKLISSAAFLHYLGPDYRFKTRLYGNGMQRNDTWEGDLIVIGAGDPTIDGTFYNGNAMYVFERWAEALQIGRASCRERVEVLLTYVSYDEVISI